MHKQAFNPSNAAMLLIDHQLGTMSWTHSHDVKATGRKKLYVAGVTTEICVLFPVLQMLDEGYEVQVSADASASNTRYGDDLALRRMAQAGAIITTVDQIISELAIDWTTPLGGKLSGILAYR